MKKIAFFDFDGTITTKDSMLELIKFQHGAYGFYKGFLINLPLLIGLKIKLVSSQRAKESILKRFFGGMDQTVFQSECDRFATVRLPSIIRSKALATVKELKEQGFAIVIVSASAENWIKKWSNEIDVSLIATQLEVINERITGRLAGKNCNGEEKAIRIRAAYDLSQYAEIYCYGDSSGDKAMLALATTAFFKPFRSS